MQGKKHFRARVAGQDAARYPSLLQDAGRRSFLRALGGGLLAAATGRLLTACDGTSSLAGLPDFAGAPGDASVDRTPDHWVSGGVPDMPFAPGDMEVPDGSSPLDSETDSGESLHDSAPAEGGTGDSGAGSDGGNLKDSGSPDAGERPELGVSS